MRQVNNNTNFERVNFHPEADPIVEAVGTNKRIFQESSFEESDNLVDALKYTNQPKQRANFRDVTDINSSISNKKANRILEILGYPQGLKFQLDAWEKYDSQFERMRDSGDHSALMVTAPTGFGKTACFTGSVVRRIVDERHGRAVFVYPSRALLQDQFSRMLEVVNTVQETGSPVRQTLHPLSIGVYYGKQPYTLSQLFSKKYDFLNKEDGTYYLNLASHWDDTYDDRRFEVKKQGSRGYRLIHSDSGVEFTHDDIALHRKLVSDSNAGRAPDIVLTTLESLENIAMKPHYDIISEAETIVFDEVHQYTGLRGSHAANIIRNIKKIKDKDSKSPPALFVGSSATLEGPERFGQKLFGLSPNEYEDIDYVDPQPEDIIEDPNDLEHYYFALTPPDGPGVASLYIQQAMMIGHSLLEKDDPPEEIPDKTQLLSFIDSKSQINQLGAQLSNADHAQQLWKEHDGIPEGDWRRLAEKTGHHFRDGDQSNPNLEITPMHADSNTTFEDLRTTDVIQATSFLEMGIDIDTLQYVMQYRPPNEVSAFKQRAGRAGRIPGLSSHTFVLLSGFAGDNNFYYRASRFLDAEVKTPLQTENNVIQWMHSCFYEYYNAVDEYRDNHKKDWGQRGEHERNILRILFEKRLGWTQFTEFLLNPSQVTKEVVGLTTHEDTLLYSSQAEDLAEELKDERKNVDQEISEKAGHLTVSGEDLAMSNEPAKRALAELRDQIREIGNNYQKYGERVGVELEDKLWEKLGTAPTASDQPIESQFDALEDFYRDLDYVRATINRAHDGEIEEKLLREVKETIDIFQTSQGDIERLSTRRKKIHYLEQAAQQAAKYDEFSNRPHTSLYLVKNLFRAAYYFNRAVQSGQLESDQEEEIWYVPPNYFSDSGRYYQLASESASRSRRQKSIDSILGQYIPYKSEYIDNEGTLNVFQPTVERTEDGHLQMTYPDVTTRKYDDIQVPEHVKLKEVQDVTHDRAKGIVPYCNKTYQLLADSDARPPGGPGERRFGKVYASADIQTRATPKRVDDQRGALKLAELNAKAWIGGVTLEITPDEDRNPSHAENEDETVEITAGERLGYQLDTRGVFWEFGDQITQFVDGDQYADLRENIRKHHGEGADIEQILLDTAGHFLTLLIADTTGVSARLLRYSINKPRKNDDVDTYRVTVFEQTEGGQGIVDLFIDKLYDNPGDVLRSVYGLAHNPQVIAEKVWSDPDAVQRLYQIDRGAVFEADTTDEHQAAIDEVHEILKESPFNYQYQETLSAVTDELFAQLREISSFITDRDLSDDRRVFNLKHDIAKERVRGKINTKDEYTDIPRPILNEYTDVVADTSPTDVERAFWSPDIDDCELNLQLPNVARQANDVVVSNTALQSLLQECIIEEYERTEDGDARLSRSLPPAWSDENTFRYLEF
jgi:superfamily II DNA/RNA helicase